MLWSFRRYTIFPYTTLFRSLPCGAELATSRRRRGCLRKPCERAVPELGRSFQVELMGERERALRMERDDLRVLLGALGGDGDRKSTRLNSSHVSTSYAVLCL